MVIHNNLFDVDPRTAELADLDEDLIRFRKLGPNKSFGDNDIRLEVGWYPNASRDGMYHMRLHENGLVGRFVGRDLRTLRAEVERWMHDPPESRRAIENLERAWFDGPIWVRGIVLADIARGPRNADPRSITPAFRARAGEAARVWRERKDLPALKEVLRLWLGNVIADEAPETEPWIAVRDGNWKPGDAEGATGVITGLLETACPQGKRAGMLYLGILCHEPMHVFRIDGPRPAVMMADEDRIAICFRA